MNAYLEILERVHDECLLAGRKPEDVKVVVISKMQPIEKILEVYNLGCRDFGENRVQEALEKQEVLPKDIHHHFTGTLQKNKVSKVINKFSLIHSVDSLELAAKLSALATEKQKILLQVNTSKEETKHGLTIEEWLPLQEALFSLQGIEIQGLMTMGPRIYNPSQVSSCFSSLRKMAEIWNIPTLSMGMSQDFSIAIKEGATLLRIGSAIFTKS